MMNLCLGTVQLGMDYGVQGDVKPSKAGSIALLSDALKYGITTFDTAGGYGDAENVLGEFLKQNSTDKLNVISKFSGDSLNNFTSPSKHKDEIISHLKSSLNKLNLKRLEGYLFHNAAYINDIEKLKALCSIKESDLTENVGISVYTPDYALIAAKSEYIDYIQVPYNPLDHRLDLNDFFKIAKENGKTIFVRSAFLQGLLTMNPDMIPDYAEHTKAFVKQFHKTVQNYEYTPLEGCIAFIKANPMIDYYVMGVINQQQLHEIVATFNNLKDIPIEYIKELQREFSKIDETIINPSLWRK